MSPPATTPPPNNCAAGFTLDAAGICTEYPDAYLLANLNTILWSGSANIPTEQINRIDPQILAMYSTTTGVNAGTVLAYMLGLGGPAPDGTIMQGSDGNAYQSLASVYYRQGTATGATTTNPNLLPPGTRLNGLGRLGRLGALGALSALAQALPITRATLIMASSNPAIAQLVGRDPAGHVDRSSVERALYAGDRDRARDQPCPRRNARHSNERGTVSGAARGRGPWETTSNLSGLGTLRPARRGAFPWGTLTSGFRRATAPFSRRPAAEPVPAGRGGRVPARMGLIADGGGNHRWARSPFPRPSWWREAE